MTKLVLEDLASLANATSAVAQINENSDAIVSAIENTLSRDGTAPNQMEADFDMNSYKILNVADPVDDTDGVNKRSVRGMVDEFANDILLEQFVASHHSEKFVATASQTTFPLAGTPSSIANTYVFDDGVHQIPNEDYTLVDGDTIEFAVGRTVGHEIVVRYFETVPVGENLTWIHEGAGAVERTVEDRLREHVSVLDYGAAGDGVTDDEAAFLAALAVGKPVYVPPGTYLMDNLVIPSNSKLFGHGQESIIKALTLVTAPDMIFRLNSNDNIEISHLRFEVDKTDSPTKHIIWCDGSENIHIHDCHFEESGLQAIHLVNVTNAIVERNFIVNAAQNGILCSGARIRILNNYVNIPNSTLYGIALIGATRCQISDNTVNDTGHFGIFVEDGLEVMVSDNITFNTDREGINLANSNYCKVMNNTLGWDGSAGSDFGLSLWGDSASCSHNDVIGNIVVNAQHSGIANAGPNPGSACSYNLYANNHVYDCNLDGGNWWGSGILIYGPNSVNNKVDGNFLYSSTGDMFYGVHEWAGGGGKAVGTWITNNRVIGAATSQIERNLASADSHEALNGQALKDYVPVVTSAAGTITAYTVNSAKYYEVEKMVYYTADVTIDTNGTGSGQVRVTLPIAASGTVAAINAGRDVTSGDMLQGLIAAGGTYIQLFKYDNTYPGADATRLLVSGWYRRA
jgi:parallel beta-helix repeat protein